jgi:chromosome segregation ATPase
MSKGSSKSTAAIQRLLEERRQYQAWIARLDAAGDASPGQVKGRVRADYVARLAAVTEELKAHADAARQLIEQRKESLGELQQKEKEAAERLSETELRHAVGEYDETQWGQVHKDALAELVSVREEMQAVEQDIEKLTELDALVREKSLPKVGSPPKPVPKPDDKKDAKRPVVDELAFLKSVTEDEKGGAPSPKRASGAQYQPTEVSALPKAAPGPASQEQAAEEEEAAKTLKCKECGTMNLPTEWYCESCGAELAAL